MKIVLKKYKFPPNKIYNMDKSGFQAVSNKLLKHVALTSKKEVAKNLADEQGKNVTVTCSMGVMGPCSPIIHFSPKRLNHLFK